MAGWRDITRVDYDGGGALHKRQGIDPFWRSYISTTKRLVERIGSCCGLKRPQGHPSPEEGKKKDVRCVTTTRTRGNYYYFYE